MNPLAQGNPRVIYPLLFHAVADTLTTFARDPRHLGGDRGATAILHTWGQNLSQHLHLHCVVTGGALASDGARWIPAPPGFLFPVRALAQVFRGKFLDALRRAYTADALVFAGSLAPLAEPRACATWLAALRHPDWVVYANRPFAGPEQVLEYLGRYTHRVALSNDRLLSLDDGRVRFRWKDYADGARVNVMELEAEEFLRRFLLHVVPDGFVRIRHFGFLANRTRKGQARPLPGAPRPTSRAGGAPGRIDPGLDAAPHRPRYRTLCRLPPRAAPRHRDLPAHAPARSPHLPLEHVVTPASTLRVRAAPNNPRLPVRPAPLVSRPPGAPEPSPGRSQPRAPLTAARPCPARRRPSA